MQMLKPSYLHMRGLAGFLHYLRPITKLVRAASMTSVVMDVRVKFLIIIELKSSMFINQNKSSVSLYIIFLSIYWNTLAYSKSVKTNDNDP